MEKLKEKILNQYRSEYMWTAYYNKLLDHAISNKLSGSEKKYYMNNYLKHNYALSLVTRLLSKNDHKNYLPDIRAAAIVERDRMYNNFILNKGSETA